MQDLKCAVFNTCSVRCKGNFINNHDKCRLISLGQRALLSNNILFPDPGDIIPFQIYGCLTRTIKHSRKVLICYIYQSKKETAYVQFHFLFIKTSSLKTVFINDNCSYSIVFHKMTTHTDLSISGRPRGLYHTLETIFLF